MKRHSILALALALACACTGASAQTWPTKPVRLISQFPPGGGTDLIARNLIPKLGEAFGQQFILEHKPGAAGNIAAEFVAKSPADGYVILIANNTIVIQAAMPQKLPFDVVKDFTPIAVVASTPVALAVHPDQPVKSVQDLIALARAQPGKLSYSSCGNGTAMHLAGELFKQLAKVDILHVPYKGCGPAIVDGISGQVPILFNTITNTTPQAKGGRLRIVAVASATRSPVDKELPTIAEAGLKDFDADIWFGFMAPADTSREAVMRLNAELNRIVRLPDVAERLAAQLFDVRTGTPEEFTALVKADVAKWSKVVRDGNIKAD
jgi:tripartite-type tricarboxylate transporter receptor subunit TctC